MDIEVLDGRGEGDRRRRALALIACALVALAAASFAFLRPPSPAATPALRVTSLPGAPMQGEIIHSTVDGGRTDGGYFVWRLDQNGASGPTS